MPYWLKHHVPLFDGGVIIDYRSTDNSLDIVRELAPHWKIITTKNKWFDEPEITNEVMSVEETLSGWKMVLNITEFVLHPNLREYVKTMDKNDKRAIRGNGVIMVDRMTERNDLEDKHLVLQKTYGYFEEDVLIIPGVSGYKERARSRLLHNFSHGDYKIGRHRNNHTDEIDEELFICWFGYAPMNYITERRLQIQYKSLKNMKHRNWREYYCIDEAQLEKFYQKEHERSYNLLSDPIYRHAYEEFKAHEIS